MSNPYGNSAMQADNLLFTKLMPPHLHASLIARAGLFAYLSRGLDKKLTLVTAPTGFGKTTLVSAWLAAQKLTAAWVTLDEGDNDPVRFWRYLINAFRQMNEEVGKSTLAALRVAQQPSFTALLPALINDLAQLPEPSILVLDDIHTISSPEVLESLQLLIEHLPPNLHLILIARSEPDLPVALLRARGELNELHADDLRFSESETETFLGLALPFELPAHAVHRLEEKTEGWAAGIRLVALAIQSKSNVKDSAQFIEQFIETFNGEHHFVLAYLRKEVFEKQPEVVRSFLLHTCFLDRLSGSLCDCLSDQTNGASMLEQLAQANLFVLPLGMRGGEAWYRYQSLFAEAMRHDAMKILGEPTVLRLYEKASRWYELHGFLEEAIGSALASRQPDRAIYLIEQFIEQRSFNEILILRGWCAQLPAEMFQQHPLVAFNYAQALLFSSDRYAPATAAVVEPLLYSAEATWRTQENEVGIGQVLTLRGILAWWQGDLKKGFQFVHQALQCLPESELLWRSTALLGLGNEAVLDGSLHEARNCLLEAQALSGAVQNIHAVLASVNILGEVDYLQVEMDQSSATYERVLAEAVGGDEMLDDQSIAWLGLARIAYERNDLKTAEEQAARALELSTRRSNEAGWVPCTVMLAGIAQARGETVHAQTQLLSLLPRIRQIQNLREVWAALARLSLASGDLPAAQRWYELISAQAERPFTAQREQEELLKARLWIAEGKPDQALMVVKEWRAAAQAQGRVRDEIETLCLEAQALDRQFNAPQAQQRLAAALAIAQPKGLRRIFLDEGEPLARLLASAVPTMPKRSLGLYATALLHTFPVRQPDRNSDDFLSSARLVEPLSAQEIRVLRLIAAGRSNPDIADELVVSVNTIKTQVQSIYRKLNVNSREEARDAARELGLI